MFDEKYLVDGILTIAITSQLSWAVEFVIWHIFFAPHKLHEGM